MKLQRNFTMASCTQQSGFFVRGTGHFIINEKEVVKMALHGEIFWCINGAGTFMLDGQKYTLHPGEIFYYPPKTLHDFAPADKVFNYRWLSIDGKNAGVLFQSLGFSPGVMDAGDCPEDLFTTLELYLQNNIKEYQLKSLNIAFQILTTALTPKSVKRPLLEQVKEFIDNNFWQENLGISELADYFQMHRVSLTRQFQEYFGITPGKYLASVRLQHGIKMLAATTLSLKEIAPRCGFNSADYLSKAIRKNTKNTLRELRIKNSG